MVDGEITLDTTALIAALERLGPQLERRLKAAAKETADAIAREARARLSRQLGPAATGRTLAGIQVQENRTGTGYVVVAERAPLPELPYWLEKGTKRGVSPRSFFDNAGRLEEGAHRRRVERAVHEAIEESGLGD